MDMTEAEVAARWSRRPAPTMTEAEVAAILAAIRATVANCGWAGCKDLTVAAIAAGMTGVPGPPPSRAQVTAIMLAAEREVNTHEQRADAEGYDLAGLCSANQDALIDDLWEDHPDDRPHRFDMADLVRTYDGLLGTRRADTDLPT
jgi:hypothetical protein